MPFQRRPGSVDRRRARADALWPADPETPDATAEDAGPPSRRSSGRQSSGRQSSDPDVDAEPEPEPEPDPESVARAICLRLLGQRARTRAELAATLAARHVPEAAAEAVLERFDEVGLIDDRSFASAWATARRRDRGLAKRAIAAGLKAKGIAAADIASVVAEVSEDDERELARALVRRRLRAMGGLPAATKVRRLAGMLARKGYPAGIAYAVVREVLSEGDDGPALDAAGGSMDDAVTGMLGEADDG